MERFLIATTTCIVVFTIALIISKLLQKPLQKILNTLSAQQQNWLGLLSGFMIFCALLMAQEEVISGNGLVFRVSYALGCVGFTIINSDKLPVMALQSAFVVYLFWKIVQ